ncbi:hypothetical protein V1512DRAFT_242732 [Lipomyces arxii]|uniref:uncharacterized protein n=1 Tax=Lipomyces arxii TaxID=56418 RepID=UPI0034CF0B27
MFVFPANNEGYRKRKRAHKACEQCKRRRKRCEPPVENHERCAPCMKENIACSLVPKSIEEITESSGTIPVDDIENSRTIAGRVMKIATEKVLSSPTSKSATIVAEVKPETKEPVNTRTLTSASVAATAAAAVAPVASSTAATLDAVSTAAAARSANSSTSPDSNEQIKAVASVLGASGSDERLINGFATEVDPVSVLLTLRNVDNNPGRIGVWVTEKNDPPNKQLLAYLDSIHAFDLPAKSDRDGLINVYFKYIHPILPIFDKSEFLLLHARNKCPTLLLHAVLLAACRQPAAKRFIRLQTPRHFASITATKIRALMHAEIEGDKLTVIRVLALLSLHSEGVDGLERSSADLELAFHYAHYLGLHDERRSQPEQSHIRRLWWCLWCLDRVSTCVSARPVISRLDDVGVSLLALNEEGWLGKWFEVCQILDNVIAMYRPSGSTLPPEVNVEVSYGRDEVHSPFASFLHLLRHVACILAHKRAPESPEESVSILLKSASQILHIVKTQSLPSFPAVPYAVSLTLTVYLRLFPSPEATKGWQESCRVLDSLSKTWWVAEAMSGTTRALFRKLEEDLVDRQAEEAASAILPEFNLASTFSQPTVADGKRDLGGAELSLNGAVDSTFSNLSGNPDPIVPSLASGLVPTIATSASTPTVRTSTPSLETQFLDMFSDLPNPTSFLDQVLMLDDFSGMSELWMPDLQLEDAAVPAAYSGSSVANGHHSAPKY